jgi:tetratricopeptide (TPR) repeat protein
MKSKKPHPKHRLDRLDNLDCQKAVDQMDRGDHEAALACLDAVLARTPDHYLAGLNKGLCLSKLGRLKEAIQQLHTLYESFPQEVLLLKMCGLAYGEAGHFVAALQFFQRYTEAKPNDYEAWASMCQISAQAGKDTNALMYAAQALSLAPLNPDAYNNLGAALLPLGRLDEAAQAFETTLALKPNNYMALSNLGSLSHSRGEHEKAISYFEKALSMLDSGCEDYEILLYRSCFPHLGAGYLKEGWRRYEYGFSPIDIISRHPKRKFPKPRWSGEPLGDKRLLVWAEQGLGDELQFFGELNEVRERCDKIVVECDPRLVSLLGRSYPDITVRADRRDSAIVIQDFDTHIPAGSLAGLFRNDIDDFKKRRPYIKPDPEMALDFSERLSRYTGKKLVGLSWRSGNVSARRSQHYLTLDALVEILTNPSYAVVNLQYGDCEDELLRAEAALGIKIVRWHDVNLKDDQEAVAALISQLDVVLSPQSAVAQLTMAVGVPLIIFGQPTWMSLGQEHYPWSKNAELFTPNPGEELSTVVPRIVASLDKPRTICEA